MLTTTIRFEDDLKERVSGAAARAGKTAHAFIRDAIPWEEGKAYMKATAAGAKVERPVPRKISDDDGPVHAVCAG